MTIMYLPTYLNVGIVENIMSSFLKNYYLVDTYLIINIEMLDGKSDVYSTYIGSTRASSPCKIMVHSITANKNF